MSSIMVCFEYELTPILFDREQQSMRPRRSSTMGPQSFSQTLYNSPASYRASYANPFASEETIKNRGNRPRTERSGGNSHDDDDEVDEIDEGAPLISSSNRSKSLGVALGYGPYGGDSGSGKGSGNRRESSRSSSRSKRRTIFDRQSSLYPQQTDYNVNYPPSIPGSPELGAVNRDISFGDMMVRDDFAPSRDSPRGNMGGESLIDVGDNTMNEARLQPGSPVRDSGYGGRRHTIALQAEEDVCFPIECMSEMADDDLHHHESGAYRRGGSGPRRRRGKWPDLAMLDEWSRFEKEGRSEERRAKKITEPQLIGGRLRPIHRGWHRAEDDAPYRFTYFNEEFQSTIHSQTISELVQTGGSFRELFIPDPPELTDSSSDEEEDNYMRTDPTYIRHTPGPNGESRVPTRNGSLVDQPRPESRSVADAGKNDSRETSGEGTPSGIKSPGDQKPEKVEKPKRYGERPTWWLDVLSPTDAEMKVLAKTFGIHPLTAEDIIMQEAREKVELFRNYYFVNYRSFEQDMNSEDFLEPVNMYVVVFREGVLSFHFSMTPHPANVRRRIRQLKDYMILSSDWISYAIIDDITDVFAPLIQNIEDEVDNIDDAILRLHSPGVDDKDNHNVQVNEKKSDAGGDCTTGESSGDMLRRVGDCRKKVMGLYRLLGNKADVIKGFAKRCNEHWEVAPRSEIGLYLGDIQDHIVTMTGNLSHYEKFVSFFCTQAIRS
jgi:magnesium transporter